MLASKPKSMKMGVAYPVANTKPKPNSASIYMAIKVEDLDGGNERVLLLTPHELYRRSTYGGGFIDSKLKMGRCYPFTAFGEKQSMYLIKVQIPPSVYDKTLHPVILRVSEGWLYNGEERAKKNSEDVPGQGFWRNLFD